MPRSGAHARVQQLDQVPYGQILRNQLPMRRTVWFSAAVRVDSAVKQDIVQRMQLEVRADHAFHPESQLLRPGRSAAALDSGGDAVTELNGKAGPHRRQDVGLGAKVMIE